MVKNLLYVLLPLITLSCNNKIYHRPDYPPSRTVVISVLTRLEKALLMERVDQFLKERGYNLVNTKNVCKVKATEEELKYVGIRHKEEVLLTVAPHKIGWMLTFECNLNVTPYQTRPNLGLTKSLYLLLDPEVVRSKFWNKMPLSEL